MIKFIDILQSEIHKSLPGTEVQWQMASSDRFVRDFPKVPGPDAREAAVLILLYPEKNSVYTLFMQRHNYDGIHGGQISFPGGKKEPSDEDLIQTALREAQEETGIDPAGISVIGTLTPLFIPVSNMNVTPVVGWAREKPAFNHQSEEVDFLFDADLKILLDPLIIKTKPFDIRGESLEIRYFDYEGNVIWGATAMMLNELLAVLKRISLRYQL